jgi:hypothetical protein
MEGLTGPTKQTKTKGNNRVNASGSAGKKHLITSR